MPVSRSRSRSPMMRCITLNILTASLCRVRFRTRSGCWSGAWRREEDGGGGIRSARGQVRSAAGERRAAGQALTQKKNITYLLPCHKLLHGYPAPEEKARTVGGEIAFCKIFHLELLNILDKASRKHMVITRTVECRNQTCHKQGGVGIGVDLPSAESFGMDLEIPSWDGLGSRVLEGTHVLCGIWGFGMRNTDQHDGKKERNG